MSGVVNLSRRGFLKAGAAVTGGLILGVHVPGLTRKADAIEGIVPLNAFVRIGIDDTVSVVVNHSEMGQGAYTSVPMMVADELEADWSNVTYEAAPVAAVYNHTVYGIQMTGGSTSTWSEWERVRKAGATARVMLVETAAKQWGVAPSACTAKKSVVHGPDGQTASYGALAGKAAAMTPPENVTLKDPKDFNFIGKSTRRLDSPPKCDGSAIFGLDVRVPGMLVAVVARPPVFGATVVAVDDSAAKAVTGVQHIVPTKYGVAVLADGFWPAKKGRDALKVTWDEGPLASLDSVAQGEEYAAMATKPGAVATSIGDAGKTLGSLSGIIDAEYDLPYLAHAPMEPLNVVADVRTDACTVWTGTQFQTGDRDAAAEEAGLPADKVTLHTTLLGGGFGRRAVPDSHMVREAVLISKAIGKPVKVVWTREEDTRGGYYRPRAFHRIQAAVGTDGQPAAWHQRIVCQSFMAGTPFEPFVVKDGVDDTAVEGARELPYAIPNLQVEYHQAPDGVPTLWWRSVGHSHTAFVVETMMDELAHAAGADPWAYRLELSKGHARFHRVVQVLGEKAGWSDPPPEGIGRGMAVHESFGSTVGHVVEASVSDDGAIHVHRVVAVIDCGPVVNPDTILAQLEGGTVFGLTAALHSGITFENGRVNERNFHDYPMVRMHESPKVEPYLIESTEQMGGVGEPGVPSVAPALANAVFAATGVRIRRLPMRLTNLARA